MTSVYFMTSVFIETLRQRVTERKGITMTRYAISSLEIDSSVVNRLKNKKMRPSDTLIRKIAADADPGFTVVELEALRAIDDLGEATIRQANTLLDQHLRKTAGG